MKHLHSIAFVLMFFVTSMCQAAAPESLRPSATQPSPQPAEEEVVLFDRALDEAGARLVVVKGPSREIAPLTFFFEKSNMIPEIRLAWFREVRVEVRSRAAPPLTLGVQLISGSIEKGQEWPDVVVLDALVEREQVVLALGREAQLTLWQLGYPLPISWNLIVRSNVSVKAVPGVLHVGMVKLSRTADRRLAYEVIHANRYHSIYEQTSTRLPQFKLIRAWDSTGQFDLGTFIPAASYTPWPPTSSLQGEQPKEPAKTDRTDKPLASPGG